MKVFGALGGISHDASRLKQLRHVTHAIFFMALVVVAARGIRDAKNPFTGPHAFVDADLATTARTFVTEGILKLHGIPVNNNPPIARSDYYMHWPPLLPWLLSFAFRAFGPTEQTAHIFMLVVFMTTAILMYFLGRAYLGPSGGALTSFFWLILPVTVRYQNFVAQEPFAMMFVVAAFLAFKRSSKLGALLLFFAVISSWEAALVAPAFWVVSRFRAELKERAYLSFAVTAVGLSGISFLYLLGNPQAALDTIQAAKFYMGISHVYSHSAIPLPQVQIPLWRQIQLTFLNNVWMLGPIGLAAIAQFASQRDSKLAEVIIPLAAPWIAWCVVMHNHTARHEFEFLIAAPTIALSLAWFTMNLVSEERKAPLLKTTIIEGAALLQTALILLLLHRPPSNGYDPNRLIAYGKSIERNTTANSIVLAPLVSAVPLYYSDRHIVRGIGSPQAAREEVPRIRRTFPGAPIYLAIPPMMSGEFKMKNARLVSSNTAAIIYKVE